MKHFLIAVASVLLVASSADAQRGLQRTFSDYREVKGVQEFTGTMIVKALSFDEAQSITGSFQGAVALRERAKARIAPFALRYEADIDWFIVQVPVGLSENQYRDFLLATGEYRLAEPNFLVFPCRRPNDPQFGSQWHHQRMRSELAWDLWTGSSSLVVAVTDTGCDLNHPDLRDSYVSGYNAVDDRPQSQGGQVNDLNGHGTHVAGCAAAIGNNGIGVTGMGWNFKIMPIRVSNSSGGGATYEWLSRGARWAADNGAKTISASYSGVDSSVIEETGQYVRSRNALYLYAAGNEGRNLSGFDHRNVLVIGASNPSDGRPSWSNYGRGVDFFAPGEDIYATYNGGGYGSMSGTSMATPIANGVCAMIWSARPNLSPSAVEWVASITCKDLGPPGNDDTWGWGRLDLYDAVRRAMMALNAPPTP